MNEVEKSGRKTVRAYTAMPPDGTPRSALDPAVLELALSILLTEEGFVEKPYRDDAGVLTVGIGRTVDVDPNAKVSYKDEVAWTKKRVAEDLRWLQERVGAGTKLPAGVWAAVASWMYNVGRSAAARSTLVRRMEQGRWDQIAPELRRWVYVTDTRTGTKIRHPVLIARREAEATLVERSLAAWRGAGEDDGMRAPHGTIEAERIPALATDAGRAAILTTVAGSSAAVLERMVSSASSALQWGVFFVVVVMVVVAAWLIVRRTRS